MNEIVIKIKIEGLDWLVTALQTLTGAQTGEERPKSQEQQASAAQMPQAPAQTPLSAPAPGIPALQPAAFPAPVPAAPATQIGIPGQIIPQQPGTPTPVPAAAQQSVVPLQPLAAPPQQPAPIPVAPAQQPVTAPAPVPTAPTQQIPTTAAPEQYSFDKLAVALSNVCALPDGQPKVHALLQQFGVNALFDLPKDRYGDFATALRGIGGVI